MGVVKLLGSESVVWRVRDKLICGRSVAMNFLSLHDHLVCEYCTLCASKAKQSPSHFRPSNLNEMQCPLQPF